MINTIKLFLTKTIKRQLILGMVATFLILMSIFMINLISNQKDFLHNQSLSQTISLANTFSKNSTSWVLSNDFIGMEEIVESIKEYPSLQYAMLLSLDGKVLAHSDKKYTNQYINDKISIEILSSKPEVIILLNNANVIDIAVPILRDTQHIGWARIALGQEENTNNIKDIENHAILYILFAIFIAGFFSYIFAKWLTKDLYNLIDVAKQTTTGTKNLRADFTRGDEIGILASNINDMLDKIDLDEVKLKEELEKNINKDKLLTQQSKMASMGEMLENIAHQWRQPLSVISTASTGVLMQKEFKLSNEDKEIEALNIINDSAQHLSKTIDDFRDFFKPDKDSVLFSVKDVYYRTFGLLESKFKNRLIEVIEDIEDVEIFGLDGELIQVIMNILNNARDILETKDDEVKRLIFISIHPVDNEVVISIKDNGGGIPENIINNIFDPYFTTKHQSQGTGIGLYMSEEIVVKHMYGTISVENQEYKYQDIEYTGACFIIKLPISL